MTLLLAFPATIFGKIADPAPVVVNGVQYSSHANVVTAKDQKTGKELWQTKVYPTVEPEKYAEGLEKDVQWNIIVEVKEAKGVLTVKDSKGASYQLDAKSGKAVK
jgi:outer membrane protein assembly factor BamB